MPAEGWVISNGWLAVEVVIAVTGTTNAVEAANDNVCAQGVTSAEGAVGIVGGADDLRAIVSDLSRGDGSRSRKEECLDKHFD